MTDSLPFENLLPLLLHHLRAGVVIFAPDTRFLFANTHASELMGLTMDQLAGKTALDPDWAFLREDGAPMPPEEYPVRRVLDTLQPLQNLVVGVDRPASRDRVWTLVNAFPEFPGREDPGRIVVTFIDISERKRANDHLRSLSRMQSVILDNSTVGITFVRNRIQEWANPRMAELFGLPLERIQGISTRVLYPDEASYNLVAAQAYPLLAQGQKASFEIQMKKGDDSLFWCHFEGKALDPSRPQDGSIWICEDISERKRAEESLPLSLSSLRAIIENQPGLVWLKDADGRFLAVNSAFARSCGQPHPDRVVGKTDRDIWPPDLAEQYMADDQRVMRDRSSITVEEQILDQGQPLWHETFKTPVIDADGSVIGTTGYARDITARRKAEIQRETLQTQLQQAQKMDSIGRLAGGVAHDFNNMLGVILGHADLALAQIDPSLPFHADIQEIQKAANHSADLTRQLLAFARKQTVAPRALDLNETIEGMLKMLRRLIGENIDLAWHPSNTPNGVLMDPSQIDQILANLCVNARDAIAETGKVTIETDHALIDDAYCATHPGFSPGDFVLLAVSDNGCGMDSETLLHLFEPFFTTKKVGDGSGLGLATVYGIVKQNNGFINIYSEKGHGTTFKIYLPRHAAAGDDAPAPPPQTPPPIPRGSETILLVEDEPMLLHMTRIMLELAGYHVLPAARPADALRLADQHSGHIHLLMTDVVMPEMNGRELARALQIRHPHLKRLFTSGYTANVIAHHGILDPGVHFIQKPFSASALAAKIRETLDAPGETPAP